MESVDADLRECGERMRVVREPRKESVGAGLRGCGERMRAGRELRNPPPGSRTRALRAWPGRRGRPPAAARTA